LYILEVLELMFSSKIKTYHIHKMDDNHKCFHCDAIGSQKIYKSIERWYFFSIPTPLRRTTYFIKCTVSGCCGITELGSDDVRSMALAYYDTLKEVDKHSC